MSRWFQKVACILGGLMVSVVTLAGDPEADFDHTHRMWAKVLAEFVDDQGRVDYQGLKDHPDDLHAYLREIARIDNETYHGWTREQQLALLINLYNAQTIDMVMRRYPLSSIKDIGTLLRGPWGQPVVNLFGRITTLDNLEHRIIRPVFADPRTHFALVCAARSAPRLRREPFVAGQLEEQLNDQVQNFLSDPSRNRIDTGQAAMHLSPVFKWFAPDFVAAAGSVEGFVQSYLPPEDVAAMEGRVIAVAYREYDWSLNDWAR